MNMRAFFIIFIAVFSLSSDATATVCDEFDDATCNIYDVSNIKVAHANFIEYKLRKNHPQFFNATGQKIRIKYVELGNADDNSKNYAGYVNVKEMLDSYRAKTPYIIHLVPNQDENRFRSTVSHEIGHLLNLVCVVNKLENEYKHTSESFKKMIISGTLQLEYFNDASKMHDDRRVELIADAFKDYVLDGKPLSRQYMSEFCLE
jgi:IrrE N-terminal-like domain